MIFAYGLVAGFITRGGGALFPQTPASFGIEVQAKMRKLTWPSDRPLLTSEQRLISKRPGGIGRRQCCPAELVILFQIGLGKVPVNDVPKCFDVLRSRIAIVDVVSVLPYIARQDRSLIVNNRVVCVMTALDS